MYLKKLVLNNFLGTEKREVTFNDINNIVGRNGSGKTSIKESVLFALYGKVYGTNQLDGVITNGKDLMSVILTLEFLGKEYIIERVKSKNSSTLKVNGQIKDQGFIDGLFGDYNLFISATCAGDFMKLDTTERYELINNIISGNKEEIYEKIVGKELAEKYSFNNYTEKTIANEIKRIEEINNKYHHDKIVLSSKIEELSELKKPIVTIDEVELELHRNNYENFKATKPYIDNISNVSNAEIETLKTNLSVNKKNLNDLKSNVPDRSELDRIATLYKQSEIELQALDSAICITCKRPFEPKEIEGQKLAIQNKMDMYLQEGKKYKETYVNLFDGWKSNIDALEKDIQIQEQKILELNQSFINTNSGKIDEYNKALVKWEEQLNVFKEKYDSISNEYKLNIIENNKFNEALDKIEEYKKEIGIIDENLSKSNLLELQKVKEAFGSNGVEFQEAKEKIFKILSYMPGYVSIELTKPNKTNDGFKKVFALSQNNIDYQWLSKGMKKVIDIHLCNMISGFSNLKLIFIDDLENVTSSIQLKDDIEQVITMNAKDVDFEITSIKHE